MTNFNCACPAIQRCQGSGFLSEGSPWLTACISEQQSFWRDCADAQARLNLRCSLIQAVSLEESSDRNPDPWPLWMAGHKNIFWNVNDHIVHTSICCFNMNISFFYLRFYLHFYFRNKFHFLKFIEVSDTLWVSCLFSMKPIAFILRVYPSLIFTTFSDENGLTKKQNTINYWFRSFRGSVFLQMKKTRYVTPDQWNKSVGLNCMCQNIFSRENHKGYNSYNKDGCMSDWHSDSCGFTSGLAKHSFVEIGHEIISTAILSLQLIQVGQLSVTGERMCSIYWLTT